MKIRIKVTPLRGGRVKYELVGRIRDGKNELRRSITVGKDDLLVNQTLKVKRLRKIGDHPFYIKVDASFLGYHRSDRF